VIETDVAIVGGGPAGLMAADLLSAQGWRVDLFDAMPSVGRKFLLAGRGGLNITHSEPFERFAQRFAERSSELAPMLAAFTPEQLRAWCHALGIETFVGTSGRVFPQEMKAAPLLRAWLSRLRHQGVRVHTRHRWSGWQEPGVLAFEAPAGRVSARPRATLLALGGGSWSRLGSDGRWVPWLQERGVAVAPLKAANCGFDVGTTGEGREGWSHHLTSRHAGQPLKPVTLTFTDTQGHTETRQGEFVLTEPGIEGSLIYAFSSRIRGAIERDGEATVHLNLLPSHTADQVLAELKRPRGPRSLATHLKSRLGLHGLKVALLHELLSKEAMTDPEQLARAIQHLPIRLVRSRPMDEAISTAGGVRFEALDADLMLREMPGVFCAGEMLDWEAPTGGYLLTATMATARTAAAGIDRHLRAQPGGSS
jgi:uncharacterized flavoprotein (TIGR03862 family)